MESHVGLCIKVLIHWFYFTFVHLVLCWCRVVVKYCLYIHIQYIQTITWLWFNTEHFWTAFVIFRILNFFRWELTLTKRRRNTAMTIITGVRASRVWLKPSEKLLAIISTNATRTVPVETMLVCFGFNYHPLVCFLFIFYFMYFYLLKLK